LKVHAIQTGRVRIKRRQLDPVAAGVRRRLDTLRDREWSDWLPILAWAIEHPDGTIVVDTGESATVNEPGYLPRWHPYYRLGVRFEIVPEDELGPQLVGLGLDPASVRTVVLTHLHHDHADGLHHLPNARVLVTAREQRAAAGLRGRLGGYLLDHLPRGLRMEALDLAPDPTGAFAAAATVADGIRAVATPGHTPGHVSVVVEGEPPIVIAGDATYRLDLLMDGRIDGVAPNDAEAEASVARLRAFVERTGAVCLPTHDPDAARRLAAASPMGQ
jgi:glyoxylase-like metal-dependent hydrolase (beta-lactamase superfamily II)